MGVKRATFNKIIDILSKVDKKKIKNKLSLEERLLVALKHIVILFQNKKKAKDTSNKKLRHV